MGHQIDANRIHHQWDNTVEPTLRVSSGDVVHYDLVMAGHGQVHEHATFEETSFEFDTLYNLLGPVYVEGGRPGRHAAGRNPPPPARRAGLVRDSARAGDAPRPLPGPVSPDIPLAPWHARRVRPRHQHPVRAVPGHDGHHRTSRRRPRRSRRTRAAAIRHPPSDGGLDLSLPVWCEARCSPVGIRTRCRATARCALRRSMRHPGHAAFHGRQRGSPPRTFSPPAR